MLFKFIYFFSDNWHFYFVLIYFLVSTFSGTHVRTGSYASESASKNFGHQTLVSGNIILGEMTLGQLHCQPEVQHVQGILIKVI